ncbi:aryl-alcohol dehydrogenase-like predicted oxidoreductase [Rhodococcus sp. 27YEA15]|uniref:aldo/keto reductase n=1 Tax=Rhodococcus sp. 27YEA15 TaxID=3156259 RepID=UPI003C7A2F28
MQSVRLGGTDLVVSRVALGCMGFGSGDAHNPWALDAASAEPVFRRAVDLGVTFWDTANVYGGGSSEVLVGDAIRRYTRRDEVVLATKVGLPTGDKPEDSGLSSAAILRGIDASLQRLGTDYVDLYQVHRFDPTTPVEETMEALDAVVTSGKARHIGASSMAAWQFGKMQHAADLGGWQRFVTMQDQYSLVQREEEREMLPLLADQGVMSLPWCPLAKGRLARPFGAVTTRSGSDPIGTAIFEGRDRGIVDAIAAVADARSVPMAQIALAWIYSHAAIAAPIVGATKPSHLDDAVAATRLRLTPSEISRLEAAYTPRNPSGY